MDETLERFATLDKRFLRQRISDAAISASNPGPR
jgi:hypothetical protein